MQPSTRSWLSYYENMIRNRHLDGIVLGKSFGWGPAYVSTEMNATTILTMTLAHLALFGVAAIVRLVFV